MGLDMYLSRKVYIGAKYYTDIKCDINITKNNEPIVINSSKIQYITEEAAYWRKENAIHNWFVQNIQKGIDNCANYYVDKEDLKELISVCRQVIENPEKANELLPTRSGFFFGSTEYDSCYLAGLKETIEMLTPFIEKKDYVDYEYSSSW